MTVEAHQLVEKGVRSLGAAQDLLKGGHCDFAVSRAYYAMFYLAEAALLTHDLAFSRHSAVISAFGRHLVKPGHLPQSLHEALHTAFLERTIGDYDVKQAYPRQRAESVLASAQDFVAAVQAFLEHGHYGEHSVGEQT